MRATSRKTMIMMIVAVIKVQRVTHVIYVQAQITPLMKND